MVEELRGAIVARLMNNLAWRKSGAANRSAASICDQGAAGDLVKHQRQPVGPEPDLGRGLHLLPNLVRDGLGRVRHCLRPGGCRAGAATRMQASLVLEAWEQRSGPGSETVPAT